VQPGVAHLISAMDERRQKRVADAIRDELSELIIYELSDPRIQLDGITEVHISPDGKRADVLVHTTGSSQQQDITLEALRSAAGFLRRQISVRLSLRHAPDLRFLADSEAGSGDRLEVLWKRSQKWRRKLNKTETTPSPATNAEDDKPHAAGTAKAGKAGLSE